MTTNKTPAKIISELAKKAAVRCRRGALRSIDGFPFLGYCLIMIQLYFLSILCNGLSGYILFSGNEGETAEKNFRFSFNPTFHLVLGILSAVTGVLKLLSPIMGRMPLVGDLIPAVAGVIAGLLLIFGIYRQDSPTAAENQGSLDQLGVNLLKFRKSVGLGLMAVALLHFLFPEALFL